VGEVGEWEESVWKWRPRWRHARFEWESIQEEEMVRLISTGSLSREVQDVQKWGGDVSGEFTVDSANKCLASFSGEVHSDIFKLLWQAKAFPNAMMTAWRVLLDRLPTRSSLIRREVRVSSPLCLLCEEMEKNAQHLFLECVVAQRVWSLCFRWIGILTVQQKDLSCHFENFYLAHL